MVGRADHGMIRLGESFPTRSANGSTPDSTLADPQQTIDDLKRQSSRSRWDREFESPSPQRQFSANLASARQALSAETNLHCHGYPPM